MTSRLCTSHVDTSSSRFAFYLDWLKKHYDAWLLSTLGPWTVSTIKSYRSHLQQYKHFVYTLGLKHLPATEQSVVDFLLFKEDVMPDTQAKYKTALSAWHQSFSAVTGVQWDPAAQVSVLNLVRRNVRLFQPRHHQKLALPVDLMVQILCDPNTAFDVARWHRRLVFAVCILGMLRAGAACGIVWHPDPSKSDVHHTTRSGKHLVRLCIRQDKTQRIGECTVRWLMDGVAPGGFSFYPFLVSYLQHVHLPPGFPLLSFPSAAGWLRPDTSKVSKLVKEAVLQAGLDPARFAAHSLRRSGATWFVEEAHLSTQEIMHLGVWLSSAVDIYTGTADQHSWRVLEAAAVELDKTWGRRV
jgi:integrase